jgi:hypothetical protein
MIKKIFVIFLIISIKNNHSKIKVRTEKSIFAKKSCTERNRRALNSAEIQ